MKDVFVAGETLVDFIPTDGGSLDEIGSFQHKPGGAPANVAIGLSRLESPPRFWTRLGSDSFGKFLHELLDRHDIPEEFIVSMESEKTTLAVVSPSSKHRAFEFYDGKGGTFAFSPRMVPETPLSDPSWVHFGGVALTNPKGKRAMLDLAKRAKQKECVVSFDPNIRPSLWTGENRKRLKDALEKAVSFSDVIFCSREDFVSTPFETDDEHSLAKRLVEQGPHTVFVTLGENGAIVLADEKSPWGVGGFSHDGFDVDVVDTTGAGDAFTAGAINRLCGNYEGSNLREVLSFANRVAALAVQEKGGMMALPTGQDLELRQEIG